MPHIALDENLPGITGLFAYRPETAAPLGQLAEVLLRGPSSLSVGERELIGAVVSRGNDCTFCSRSHAAVAAEALEGGMPVVEAAWKDVDGTPVSAKVRALLHVALAVRESGKSVGEDLIETARAEGATDVEIHDTVLIAAAFCMFNRYVDGLATLAADDQDAYREVGVHLLANGYTSL
ncbi:carboxymuconolactone decarboxylase family protein [Amycolatopsis keratiniphila]|uniref:Carboxymuconolactone decarboxylase-like domain-containing protein n=1 Tax=Amycolatopsis keratiniphila TaxID=129921 RepID=R4SY20_9PSEU|nr:carboxymuconolactone decarboxylase family protein [Amycolatopsis keratiniphila]AGM03687.1 hypothetical protein AORI_1098 [Amycolatopsis keratiniphila]